MNMETNIIKTKMEKDGSFTMVKLMQQKSQMNGILGFILQKIKLKTHMKLKNSIGKNHINQISLELKKLIDQIKIIMLLKKNIKIGKVNLKIFIHFFLLLSIFYPNVSLSDDNIDVKFVEIKILDKISSKNSKLILNIGEEKKYENLLIKVLKCKNSEFDDNPEVTAYLQVRDLTITDNDKVYVFNGWTFSSSPSLTPFDHPVYDIWLSKCF